MQLPNLDKIKTHILLVIGFWGSDKVIEVILLYININTHSVVMSFIGIAAIFYTNRIK